MTLSANFVRQRTLHRHWHRHKSRCQILRSQLGFNQVDSDRPLVCRGCRHYHGQTYGYNRDTRVRLICGFYPFGWIGEEDCPEWQAE